MNLLLLSNGTNYGGEFLEYVADDLSNWASGASEILFVPFASSDHQDYLDLVNTAFKKFIGKEAIGAHTLKFDNNELDNFSHIFVGGGNSFRLLNSLYETGLRDGIMKRVSENSISYMGSSAGTNMACPTMRTTNDMPIVTPPSFDSLNIIPFQINPHYQDVDPNSEHKGETREERLIEFLEENNVPVLGLREGSWVYGEYGKSLTLGGILQSRLFTRESVYEIDGGESLDFLLRDDHKFDASK